MENKRQKKCDTEPVEYAIVDIETTGGYASGSAITEVAVIRHNGREETGRFHSLVNPGQPIPLYIQALTGINDDMIASSPAFNAVARQVYEFLDGCIFVAHNVNFDYSFIKHHLAKAGFEYSAPRLCTVRLSRKIKPGLPSYSLGRLCKTLNIPHTNRHRAAGDADATAILFSRLLEWDHEGHIPAMLKRTSREQALPPNLPRETFAKLPSSPGVYYFRDKAGKVIYVGKALNIRKRVASHFSGHNPNPQRQHFLFNIYDITTEPCGTELMALLLEAVEIKRLWPKYNRAMKRYEPRFALYCYPDQNNYLHLAVGRHRKGQQPVYEFSTSSGGITMLHRLAKDFGLCPELCQLGPCNSSCYHSADMKTRPSRQEIHGSSEAYNRRVEQALNHLHANLPDFLIIDQGRHEEEQSCIAVEQGRFYGMGYISHYNDFRDAEDLKQCLTRYPANHYMTQLVMAYAEKEPAKVKVSLPQQ